MKMEQTTSLRKLKNRSRWNVTGNVIVNVSFFCLDAMTRYAEVSVRKVIYSKQAPLCLSFIFSHQTTSSSTQLNETNSKPTPNQQTRNTIKPHSATSSKWVPSYHAYVPLPFDLSFHFTLQLLTNKQIKSLCQTIGACLMAIVNGIASVLQAIVGAIAAFFDIIISCLTCGRGGGRKRRGGASHV